VEDSSCAAISLLTRMRTLPDYTLEICSPSFGRELSGINRVKDGKRALEEHGREQTKCGGEDDVGIGMQCSSSRPHRAWASRTRASFNGGSRGVQARPWPSEAAAWHEPTAPRMSTPVQHAQSYSKTRGQLATQNRGRAATPAISRPIAADRNVRPTTSHGGHR
jgi:hypothetical protein